MTLIILQSTGKNGRLLQEVKANQIDLERSLAKTHLKTLTGKTTQ